MHIIGYVTQNLYINNHEIIISVSQGNTSQINMVNNNTYEWDQSSGKPNTTKSTPTLVKQEFTS